MQKLSDEISDIIFKISPSIRFVGIYKNNELKFAYREDITPQLEQSKTIKSFEYAVKRWEERKELLSAEIGNPVYAIAMYETVKRLTMELDDGSILLLSMELEADQEKILTDLLDYRNSLTFDGNS